MAEVLCIYRDVELLKQSREQAGEASEAGALTILQVDQLNSSAEAVGLWATQSVVHQVHSQDYMFA